MGGGFPSHRQGNAPDLGLFFDAISKATTDAFERPPELVCEPGRAMVAESLSLAVCVKAVRETGEIFLNDGVYGGLTEFRDVEFCERISVLNQAGIRRTETRTPRKVFGPTCDSIDQLPDNLWLPASLEEGDYLIIRNMGAYAQSLATEFNGYGVIETVFLNRFE